MGLQSFRGGVYNIVKIQSLFLFLSVQLEKERKAREEREKRDAEEAAERQRREEEWVRVITVVNVFFFVVSFKTGTFTCTSLSVK